MFNFLQYGTTAQVARATGAGENETAARLGAQCVAVARVRVRPGHAVAALAAPVSTFSAPRGRRLTTPSPICGIAALGIPSAFLALGGQGFLRGVSDLRTPLVIVIAGNVVNVVLELWFVYGLDLGIEGSAWGTAIAQTGMGVGMAWAILRRVGGVNAGFRPALARGSGSREVHFPPHPSADGVVRARRRVSPPSVSPARRPPDRIRALDLLALVLDAIAIAGRSSSVMSSVTAGPPTRTRQVRMIWLSIAAGTVFALGLLVFRDVIPRAFSGRLACSPGARCCGRSSRHAAARTAPCSRSTDPDRRERRPYLAVSMVGGSRRAPRCSRRRRRPTGGSAASGRRSSCSSSHGSGSWARASDDAAGS